MHMPRNPNSAPPDSSGDSVLVAEDDPIFRHLLQSWLRRWNYRVVTADNGLDAWKMIQQKDSPQMVVLDWIMPGMDGLELCHRIRQEGNSPYRYILLLTAKDRTDDVVAGLDAGADDYLTKPFDFEELSARMRAGKRILNLQNDLLEAHSSLQFESAHDPLTGLWNRRAILQLLQKELERRSRTGAPLSVMMADIDHFKEINDTHGHLAGDAVLQETARRLAGAVRSYDSVGRYGGEEFLILIPGCTPFDLAVSAERIRHSVSNEPVHYVSGEVPVTLSLGFASVASISQRNVNSESLIRAADTALYLAKANGRNRVEGDTSSLMTSAVFDEGQ